MDNKPSEIELLRRVASASRWAIDSNGDDGVKKDGRVRVGPNWVMAQGALARALKELQTHYTVTDQFLKERVEAEEIESLLGRKVFVKPLITP